MKKFIYINKQTGKKVKSNRYLSDRALKLVAYNDVPDKTVAKNTQMNNHLILQKHGS